MSAPSWMNATQRAVWRAGMDLIERARPETLLARLKKSHSDAESLLVIEEFKNAVREASRSIN